MTSFPIEVSPDSPFPIENIPFGIFSPANTGAAKRAGTAIGDHVLDLAVLESNGLFPSLPSDGAFFSRSTLNKFAALPQPIRSKIRQDIINLLSSKTSPLFANADINWKAFFDAKDVQLHVPFDITEFTDFSCFEAHMKNMTRIFGNVPIPDNFYYGPVAYSSRVSSIVPSGVDYIRPYGVLPDKSDPKKPPVLSPSQQLDYELELGILIANPVPWGTIVSADQAAELIFGFVLVNDWSNRDIQMYEARPGGPYNSKAAATSISPWVIVPDALKFAKTGAPDQSAKPVPYHLRQSKEALATGLYDITCDVHITRAGKEEQHVSRSNVKDCYFTFGQIISHRASPGCGLTTGELIATGTISSPESDDPNKNVVSSACLTEITEFGRKEIPIHGGKWIEDGDRVTFSAWAPGANGRRIGFGKLTSKVLPAIALHNL